jgi:hypothetical protein
MFPNSKLVSSHFYRLCCYIFYLFLFEFHQQCPGLSNISSCFLSDLHETAAPADFIDSMDSKNYVAVELQKPMGIVFEENDEDYGGIFVQALKDGCAAAGIIQSGDQLVAVDTMKVSGMTFDDALGKIIESTGEKTKLTLFRGSAKQLYGPTGASQAWLDEFISGGSVKSLLA